MGGEDDDDEPLIIGFLLESVLNLFLVTLSLCDQFEGGMGICNC